MAIAIIIMKIYSINDKEFAKYGKVLDLDTKEILGEWEKIEMPAEGSIYKAGLDEFEALPIKKEIENKVFGELDAQIGICYGHSHSLNGLEWHKCSEVNIGLTDLILLLGDVRDLEDGRRYNSANVEAFLLKKGEAIEVYSTTLHFCPIEASPEGFGCVVGLTKGTNLPLDNEQEDKLLFRKNKWLIAHEDNAALIARGVVSGIYGENYTL